MSRRRWRRIWRGEGTVVTHTHHPQFPAVGIRTYGRELSIAADHAGNAWCSVVQEEGDAQRCALCCRAVTGRRGHLRCPSARRVRTHSGPRFVRTGVRSLLPGMSTGTGPMASGPARGTVPASEPGVFLGMLARTGSPRDFWRTEDACTPDGSPVGRSWTTAGLWTTPATDSSVALPVFPSSHNRLPVNASDYP